MCFPRGGLTFHPWSSALRYLPIASDTNCTHQPIKVQQGWSATFQANLLASGIGASFYNSGSGIYSSGQALVSFYNTIFSPKSTLLVATVPRWNKVEKKGSEEISRTHPRVGGVSHATRKVIAGGMSICSHSNWTITYHRHTASSYFEAVAGTNLTLTLSYKALTCTFSLFIR